MAFYDNQYWILSHIRNSFLYSDDTGMCEMVHLNTDIPKGIRDEGKKLWYGHLDDSEEEFDDDGRIHARSMGSGNDDFGARRRRLNTVVRLEKMKKEQQAAALISTVRWKEPERALDELKKCDYFSKKEIVPRKTESVLSQLIARHASDPDSPFLAYAKFDGQSQIRVPTRTIKIFMTMQSKEDRNYPIIVCVVASAKVSELIGLACYKYNQEKREPPLSGPVSQYALFIAEDDGSPDGDFPCLEPREVVGKFGFTTLALVKVSSPRKDSPSSPTASPPATINKSNDTKADTEENTSGKLKLATNAAVLESTDFHLFSGFLLHKVRPKTEISIGISWDQVEIKPTSSNRSSMTMATLFWPRPNLKPVFLPMEVVVDCTVLDSIPLSLAIIYYHTEKRKWCRLRIECDTKTIEQVVAKLRFIMEIRGGHYRQEYLRHVSVDHSNKRRSLPSLRH